MYGLKEGTKKRVQLWKATIKAIKYLPRICVTFVRVKRDIFVFLFFWIEGKGMKDNGYEGSY